MGTRGLARWLTGAVVTAVLLGGAIDASAGGDKVYFKDLNFKPRIKPERIEIAVGAGAYFYATDLKSWRHWGGRRTSARGNLHYNDCKPSCAAGDYKSVNGVVKLSRIRRCGDQRRYRKIKMNFKPDNVRDVKTRLNCDGVQS